MSIVYGICCSACDSELNIKKIYLDSGQDLFLEVSPCEVCLDHERAEAYAEGVKETEDDYKGPLKELEQEINDLKEETYRLKNTLDNLHEE